MILEGQSAKEAHDVIERYIHSRDVKGLSIPYPEVLKGKDIQGMFREDSYDWTVFRYYKEGNKLIFSHRHHDIGYLLDVG